METGRLSSELDHPVAVLLSHRYGDGSLYLPNALSRDTLRLAIERGFVSSEGFVTRKGRAYLARLGH